MGDESVENQLKLILTVSKLWLMLLKIDLESIKGQGVSTEWWEWKKNTDECYGYLFWVSVKQKCETVAHIICLACPEEYTHLFILLL